MLYHTFSFHAPAPSWIDTSLLTLSLHDALPILAVHRVAHRLHGLLGARLAVDVDDLDVALLAVDGQWPQAVLAGVRDGHLGALLDRLSGASGRAGEGAHDARSAEHKSALQSIMRISSSVFCFKKIIIYSSL